MEFEAAALPNGHPAEDLAVDSGAAGPVEENGLATLDLPAETAPRGLYLVRIPKPPMDDTELKRLQADFQGHVTKLKAMNVKLQAKREVVRTFKTQMNDARGLKETSEPEFQDKSARMQELRNLRSTYITRIKVIRDNLAGLDCKSEQELDEKIRATEHRISHEGMPLREEKQLVQQIAKLNAMRGKIKEYDLHKDELVELESEVSKIKAIMGDMDGEFSVIKSERDATQKVVQDIYTNLKKAQDELRALEAEHAELQAAKEGTLKALDGSRDETNASMRDYRENRKFSLTVRDLVAAGQNDEAAAMVRAQVDEWVAKLSSDPTLRREYHSLWAAQRKFPVSELLPESCSAVQDPRGPANGAGRGGGRGVAGARAPPPEPRGPEKAKALIEQLLQEASKEAAVARARVNGGSDGDAEDEDEDATVVAAAVGVVKKTVVEVYKPPGAMGGSTTTSNSTGAAKLVKDAAAAAAAAFNYKVELPKVVDTEVFVPAVMKSDTELQTKEMLRQEQMRKNQEAEERKRKRAELAERKKAQAAETAKRLEAERRERDQQARALAAGGKAAAAAAAAAASRALEEQVAEAAVQEQAAAATAPTAQQQQVTKMSAPTAFEKRQQVAAARRFKSKATPVKQVQSFWNQYQGWIVLLAVLLLCIILAIAFLM